MALKSPKTDDMPAKLTQEGFLSRASKALGDNYDFSKSIYVNQTTPVCVICKKHGEFMAKPQHLMYGHGCPECGKELSAAKRKKDTDRFIAEANKKHNFKYDYSKTVYKGCYENVTITCPIHGDFTQQSYVHLSGHGCPYCGTNSMADACRMTTDDFIRRSKERYGDRFLYDKTEYTGISNKVIITCKKHGDFLVKPSYHLHRGPGCTKCRKERTSKLVFGVGIHDTDLPTRHPCIRTWKAMLRRCYAPRPHEHAYIGCTVCESWLRSSNFREWWEKNHIEGYSMDKDLFANGSGKQYSPDVVVFVPPAINTLISERKGKDGLHCGANFYGGKYHAFISKHGRPVHVGAYDTRVQSIAEYKKAREAYIKEVAQEYFGKGLITERVRDALFRYEVKITD